MDKKGGNEMTRDEMIKKAMEYESSDPFEIVEDVDLWEIMADFAISVIADQQRGVVTDEKPKCNHVFVVDGTKSITDQICCKCGLHQRINF